MKQRFLNNTKPSPVKQPETAKKDQVFSSFLEELQHNLKSQNSGLSSQDLLKQQTHIMQQQVDLLKQEQKSFQQVIKHLSKNASAEPKRLLTEIVVPLEKQIKEARSLYEETKSTASKISLQVSGLHKNLNKNKPPPGLENSVAKVVQKKQALDANVKETEKQVSFSIDKGQLNKCKQAVQHLRGQIEAVQKDAEKTEIDLQERFKRIAGQAQNLKSVSQDFSVVPGFAGSEERVLKILDGKLDYDDVLCEVNELSKIKNKLIQNYTKITPVFPKFPKPVQVQVIEKEVLKKPAKLVPAGPAKKTLKTKPSTLNEIATQTKVINKPSKPVSSPSPDQSSITEKLLKNQTRLEEVSQTPSRSLSPQIEDLGPIPRAPSPEPFRTRPGVTKGEQAKPITFNQIYPVLKNIETQEPPKPDLVEKTVDTVTHHILNHLLSKQNLPIKPAELKATKWLGSEEISELTRLGLHFDPSTIEKIGLDVLKQGVQDLKLQTVSQNRLKTESKEHEDDFEEEKNAKQIFSKFPPQTPPVSDQHFEKEPSSQNRDSSETRNLFDPKLLSRMSAASIQQYLAALIESGYLPKPQGTPSLFSKSPSPKLQPTTTPRIKSAVDRTLEENHIEEAKKSEPQTSPQVLFNAKESQTSQKDNTEPVGQKSLEINYPPFQELKHSNSEIDVFGRPQSRKTRIFDIDAEEKKIIEENSFARKTIQIPLLDIPRKSQSSHGECLVTDSEVSGLSHAGSVGSEAFNFESSDFFGGFLDLVKKARGVEHRQVSINEDLSEGEVRMSEGLSSGEVTSTLVKSENRLSGVLSEDFEVSEERPSK